MSHSLQPHGPYPTRLLCPWDSPGKKTGVGSHTLLQGIFLTQGSSPRLLHWQADSLLLRHLASSICIYGYIHFFSISEYLEGLQTIKPQSSKHITQTVGSKHQSFLGEMIGSRVGRVKIQKQSKNCMVSERYQVIKQ